MLGILEDIPALVQFGPIGWVIAVLTLGLLAYVSRMSIGKFVYDWILRPEKRRQLIHYRYIAHMDSMTDTR